MTEARETGLRGRVGTRLPYVLGVLGVVAGIVMAFVLPAVGSDGWSEDAKSAESAASGFVTTCFTIDPADPDAGTAALEDLVTDAFTNSCFDLIAPGDEEKAALAQAQITFGNVNVTSTGVTQIDGDSANVAVSFSFSGASPQAAAPAPLAARGIVALVKEGDDWKVADYSDIVQVEAVIGAPTDGTTPAPTPEATP